MSQWRPARMATEPQDTRMKPGWWTKHRLLAVGAAAVVVTVLVVEAQAAMAEEYHVVRVVDGDTVDVRLGHQGTTRVRLLNVDAPETVDPNRAVECLGPEASQRLKELLPEGSSVDLAFDDERTDRYGRTLAGVYADGALVNAQLASEGLAVPMTVGSNTRFEAAVEASWEVASKRHLGLFDPNAPCTAPGKVQTLRGDVASLTTAASPQRASDAAAAVIAAKAVTDDASTLQEYLVAKSASEVVALPPAVLSSLVKDVRGLSRQSAATHRALVRLEKSLSAQEKAAAEAKARAEAAARAKARAKAKAKAEARARAKARARAEAAAEARRNESTDEDDSSSSRGSGGNSGYTGPRCYAPGGKTWRPC